MEQTMDPKVSLILTTYNSAINLSKTLLSIENQDYSNIEVIIKDGGSTDHTIDIIKEYTLKSHNTVQWTSCHDQGIYDAMNQGYAMSSGDVIVFFNDCFLGNNAVTIMMEVLNTYPNCIGVHADLIYATDTKTIRYWRMGKQKSIKTGWMPGHPTLFLKREVYQNYGLYKTDYKIAADYEFMIRILKHRKNQLAYVPKVIIKMFYGGSSNAGFRNYILSLQEGNRALKENGIRWIYLISFCRLCRVVVQFLIRNTNNVNI